MKKQTIKTTEADRKTASVKPIGLLHPDLIKDLNSRGFLRCHVISPNCRERPTHDCDTGKMHHLYCRMHAMEFCAKHLIEFVEPGNN